MLIFLLLLVEIEYKMIRIFLIMRIIVIIEMQIMMMEKLVKLTR